MGQGRKSLAALVAAVVASGCGGSSGHAGMLSTAPGSSVAPVASSAPPAPALDVVPTILVHGINGGPFEYFALCDELGKGRTVLREIYVDEADALQANSLPPDVIVNFGYYRDHVGGADYDPHGSIGGCPVARTDGLDASYYTTSYAERLRRCVEGVKRATGAPRVDLVLHSMGGIVGRAYAKWLSLDPQGSSSVRRIFLIASPSRGINALETTALAVAHAGNVEFMRQGECLEMCYESATWSGQSYITLLNDDWDGFCARHSIGYAGLSAEGARGGPGGSSGSVIPSGSLPIAQIQQFLTGLKSVGTLGSIWPLVGKALANLPAEVTEALGPSDGTVRLASSRLDQPPFMAAGFWGLYEGSHAGTTNVEQTAHGSSYTAECVRAYCLEAKDASVAKCDALSVKQVDAPGRASFIEADVTISGVKDESSPLALQLVESLLDPQTGAVTSAVGYGAVLHEGEQRVAFMVPAGGGKRRYRAVVYGEHGEIGVVDGLDLLLVDGALDAAPVANVQASLRGSSAHLDFSSNGAGALYSVRFDRGAWSAFSTTSSFDTPALLPGVHRVEVRVESASNGAGVLVDGATPAAVGLVVDSAGNVRVVP